MNNQRMKVYSDNSSKIVAAVEQGADFPALQAKWPGLKKYMYTWAIYQIIDDHNRRCFHNRESIKTLRDLKVFNELLANKVFDLSSAEFTIKDVEAVLQSGKQILSEDGYQKNDEQRLTTVNDTMLAEINTCAHLIRGVFRPSKTWYRTGSYGMKHKVEHFTEIASNINPMQSSQYISNVSFIIAAILCGIETHVVWNGRNAVFKMKPVSTVHVRIATQR